MTLSVTNAGTQQQPCRRRTCRRDTDARTPATWPSWPSGRSTPATTPSSAACPVTGTLAWSPHSSSGVRSRPARPLSGGVHGAGHDPNVYDAEAMDKIMMDSMKAFPVEQEVRGTRSSSRTSSPTAPRSSTSPRITMGGPPGKFVEAWTYNGVVPGPEIQVEVGDKVRVNFNNETPSRPTSTGTASGSRTTMDGVRRTRRNRPEARENLHLRVQGARGRRSASTTPTTRQIQVPERPVRRVHRRRDAPIPSARRSGIRFPEDSTDGGDHRWCSTTPARSACR